MKILYKGRKLVKTSFVKYLLSPSVELSTQALEIMIGTELARVSATNNATIGETNDGLRPTNAGSLDDLESRLGTACDDGKIIPSDDEMLEQ